MINPSKETSNPGTNWNWVLDEVDLRWENIEGSCHFTSGKDEPETPAVRETDDGIFEADEQWPARYVYKVNQIGEEHEAASEEHHVATVDGYSHQ